MADTPEFLDTNCCMIIDSQDRLWLLWPTIRANTRENAETDYTGLLDCRSSLNRGRIQPAIFTVLTLAGGFLLADGSVQFVSEFVDLVTYRALSTIFGGEVVAFQ